MGAETIAVLYTFLLNSLLRIVHEPMPQQQVRARSRTVRNLLYDN